MKKRFNTNTPYILAALAVLNVCNVEAASYSFANTSSPIAISGTDDGTGNAITLTSVTVTTGTGTAPAGHGTQTPVIGGTSYTGTVITDSSLSSQVASDPNLVALISSNPYGDVGNGDAGETYNNAIGIHVQFSAPIAAFTFAMLDFDGGRTERREWGTSWAYNSTTMVSSAPTITLHTSSDIAKITGVDADALYPSLNAPTSLDYAELSITTNAQPDNLENQVVFDYNAEQVTDLYFLYGATGNATNNSQQSGVTGFVVNTAIPEPSSTALLGSGGLALILRRRK